MADRCVEEPLLSAWLDDELGAHAHARVAEHLKICATCATELEGLRIVRTQLRSLPERQPPAGLLRDVTLAGRRARAGAAALAAVGVLLLATTAAAAGGTDEAPRIVDVPADVSVADYVTHTGDRALLGPVER